MTSIIILLLGFYYGFLNGQYGAAAIVSTLISTRAMRPRAALLLCAIGMCLGIFLLGSQVTTTITRDLIAAPFVNVKLVLAGFVGAILWSSLTLRLGLPVSVSQSLIGGLMGAAWIQGGMTSILPIGANKVLIGLLLSPIVGVVFARYLVLLCYGLSQFATPRLNIWLQRGQLTTSFLMALVLASNDSQKIIGALLLWLVARGDTITVETGNLLKLFSLIAMMLGNLAGGWRIIHTMGNKFYKIRPIHGFGAQISSVLINTAALLYGLPISSSQITTSAIVGAGSADRLRKIRWLVVQNIMIGWLLTIPASGIMAAICYRLLEVLNL